MNSSFNVSTTNSTESRMNHSSSLPNLNSTPAAPSGLLPSLLLTPGFQNMSLRNGRRVFQSLDSSYMPDANPTGRGLQQQIPSPPLTPAPNQQINLLNPHSTNMMINSSVILPSPTPSPPAQTPSPVGVIRMSSNTTPPPSSQMNYSMINSSFTTNSPPPATSEMQSFSMLPPLTTTHATNMMINSSVILPSPTPSPPAQTHSPVGVIRMSSNTTPPPSSQMNYSMINSSFTTNSPPPATSDMESFSMLPPLTTTSSNNYFSAPSTSYGELLNGSDYLLQNMRDPPPPYPTAALNNQTEATYATLSSVPPLFHLADIPSTSSALEQYGISYAPGFHGFNARLHDFSHIISSDDGIGTSIESSRETSPEPTNGFSSVSSGDESMNGERGNNMPGLSGNSMSDPCSSSPNSPVLIPLRSQRGPICNTCGQYLKKINGEYQCQICNAAREEKRRKRKKAQSTNNKKNENICCNNCETQVTSLWRRDTNGRSLCNACGLYYKLHSKHRPKNMRKDTIQKRIRKPRNNEPKSPKKEPQSPPSDVSPSFATVNASVVPYSLPSTSSNVQSTFFYTTPTSAAGMTNSYQLPSFQIQNVNPSYMLNNPEALAENSDQDSYTQYSMMQL